MDNERKIISTPLTVDEISKVIEGFPMHFGHTTINFVGQKEISENIKQYVLVKSTPDDGLFAIQLIYATNGNGTQKVNEIALAHLVSTTSIDNDSRYIKAEGFIKHWNEKFKETTGFEARVNEHQHVVIGEKFKAEDIDSSHLKNKILQLASLSKEICNIFDEESY